MLGWHLVLGAGFAVLFGGAGYLAQGRSSGRSCLILWSAAAVFAPIAILAALYYRIAGFEPSIPFAAARAAAERALCVRDRDAGQARATSGTRRGERDLRNRRGRRARARAHHWRWREAGSRSRSR